MLNKIKETVDLLKSKGINKPKAGIILGTGLGNLVHDIDIEQEIDYSEIPNFPLSRVEYHNGKLIYGTLGSQKILAMQGRFHYYEGYTLEEITFPVRVMKLLGIDYLLISNACGSVNPNFKKGELMLLDDHINLLPDNPLRGINYKELGPQYPDMSCPYSKIINNKFIEIAKSKNIKLNKGVYAAVSGPNLETRAEYRYMRIIGADVVGMSTVPEVIVANHMSLPCAAISVITDEAFHDDLKPVNIDEIIKVAGEAEKKMTPLFIDIIKNDLKL